jgi:hypothetical protein
MSTLEPPGDQNSPFFAYGLLKPGELAFPLLEPFVASRERAPMRMSRHRADARTASFRPGRYRSEGACRLSQRERAGIAGAARLGRAARRRPGLPGSPESAAAGCSAGLLRQRPSDNPQSPLRAGYAGACAGVPVAPLRTLIADDRPAGRLPLPRKKFECY